MYKTTVKTLLLFIFCLSVKTLGAQLPYDPSQHILIKFEASASQAYIDSLKVEYNATEVIISYPSGLALWHINIPFTNGTDTFSNIHEVVHGMSSKPKIKTVGPDFQFTGQYIVDNPDYGGTWMDPLTECEGQHDYNFIAPKTTVPEDLIRKIAIIDTGIAINRKEGNWLGHSNIFDGYFSDSNIGYDFISNDFVPEDENGHGTHIAGIIALENQEGNDYPMRFYAYKAFDQYGVGSLGLMVRAVDRAISDGAHLVNISFGYTDVQVATDSITPGKELMLVAQAHNVLVIAAAGNEEKDNDDSEEPTYPASYDVDNIISVAAGDCEGELAWFSNHGEKSVDLVAPGVEILGPSIGPANQELWKISSGTSQAVGFVTYVAGVLSYQGPFDYEEVRCAILSGVSSRASLADYVATRGLLNLEQAVQVFEDCKQPNNLRSMPFLESAKGDESFQVFPNPFDNVIKINAAATIQGETSFVLRDTHGQILQAVSHHLTGQDRSSIHLNLSIKLPVGVYYLQITSKDTSYTKKLIKQ